MSTISVSLPADGSTADVADINTPITTIVNAINGGLDNSNIVSAAAIDPTKIAGGNAGMLSAFSTYTPTWTNVTIGNAVVTARYLQVGKKVTVRINVVWGSTTTASGNIMFSLPVTAATYAGTVNVGYIGMGTMYDVSAAVVYDTNTTMASTTTTQITAKAANGTWVTNANVSNTSPVTWLAPDEWNWLIEYEAA